ncbi:endonuclease/exonuclease/phosphatase family protein [Silanimonas lenta]|uniref:endonuclease/exonuclease/phosphatase family protein n=1 Tax=Silanimonas lenta TaxID=265429 RepID=UPI0003F62F29|nr:endonuclease/exonuclease/phosphatase family protein [Silanimonas lenta]
MAPRPLRLLSCNIQAGHSTRAYRDYLTRGWGHVLPAGKTGNLRAIAELARPFDVVGLQESDPGSLRSGFANQTRLLAEQAGFPYWTHRPNRRVSRIASSANGLLARFDPLRVEHHALPGRIGGRGVTLARFGEGGDAWVLAVTHLSLGVASRRMQLDFLGELLADHPRAVLMGDFNCPAHAREMEGLYRRTQLMPPPAPVATFPSWEPKRSLDHVFTAGFRVHDYRTLPAAGSDHLAVAIEIEPA